MDTGAEMEDDVGTPVKKRRIRKDDWAKVEKFIKDEFDKRQNSQFRRDHECIWREVDRQIKMKPLDVVVESGSPVAGWRNVLELGELSKVSEVIAADVRRIIFPMERSWSECHVELDKPMTPEGPGQVPVEAQKRADGLLRAFMGQQHIDFGFKSAFDKSIKEALHHGSFVAEVEFKKQMMVYDGSKVALIGAPSWVAHSMWNCYPDESPSVEATAMFYTGSMVIRKFMPLYQVKQLKGDGYMPGQYGKIKKGENKNGDVVTSDVELIVYYGDINLERENGDIYLPNSKAITANGVIIYYAPNELPFPNIIMGGYEKQDPRDPYFTSPLIKQSPVQKMATILANEYLDGVQLRTRPPIVYDGLDPQFVMSDGPVIEPGVKTPTKGSSNFKEITVGDPNYALNGLQMLLHQMQEGTGVNAIRSGATTSDRQTAYEVGKIAQGGEVRTVDFIDKLNANLRTFLYMQHELNKKHCDKYSFYSAELGTADFIRWTKKDIPKNVHFDIVGAKGVLGEEQRAARTSQVVAFASANPLFAPLIQGSAAEILLEMFQDAGNKNPERFVKKPEGQPQIPPEVMAKIQQMQQAYQECQQKLQQAELKLADKSQKQQIAGAVAEQDMQQSAQAHQQTLEIERAAAAQEMRQAQEKFMDELRLMLAEAAQERQMAAEKHRQAMNVETPD